MTYQEATVERAKAEAAVAFGVQSNGNLQWARAKLSAINAYIAKHYTAPTT